MKNQNNSPNTYYKVGKLPPSVLSSLLKDFPLYDPRIISGPGVGKDCAVIDNGNSMLVYKSDPITFATDQIGWYAIQVNVNDIATTGAVPRWVLMTLLLPEASTNATLIENIFQQVSDACKVYQISLIGGHTEITHNLERPILITTIIGEVPKKQLASPDLVEIGDLLLLTKSVPLEAASILAREFPQLLSDMQAKHALSSDELKQAQNLIFNPGISVFNDAQIAIKAGEIHAMHDPTEGGIRTAIWEMAWSTQKSILVNTYQIPIHPLAQKICGILNIDPLGSISSGSLLLAVRKEDGDRVCTALNNAGITCNIIGQFIENQPLRKINWPNQFMEEQCKNIGKSSPSNFPLPLVFETENNHKLLSFPDRDEIAKVFK